MGDWEMCFYSNWNADEADNTDLTRMIIWGNVYLNTDNTDDTDLADYYNGHILTLCPTVY